jgi:hypothetical protein
MLFVFDLEKKGDHDCAEGERESKEANVPW